MPLRARSALRSTSRRTRSSSSPGARRAPLGTAGNVGILVLLLRLVLPGLHRPVERCVAPPQLAVEVGDLAPQPRHVAARRQVDEVPDAPAGALEVAPCPRLGAGGEAQGVQEPPAARGVLQARADG